MPSHEIEYITPAAAAQLIADAKLLGVRTEALAAGRWWSYHMLGPVAPQPAAPATAAAFCYMLARLVDGLCDQHTWNPARPLLAAHNRCMHNDKQPNAQIVQAGQLCGMPGIAGCIPAKAVLYVNPGSVKGRIGMGSAVQYVYGSEETMDAVYNRIHPDTAKISEESKP